MLAGATVSLILVSAIKHISLTSCPWDLQQFGGIARHVPQARFIYVLRQPVERAYSFYVQLVKNYQNATGDHVVHRRFEDFILPECHARAAPRAKALAPFNAHFPDTPELCLAGSDYLMQIRAYLAHVPRERMLFLKLSMFIV